MPRAGRAAWPRWPERGASTSRWCRRSSRSAPACGRGARTPARSAGPADLPRPGERVRQAAADAVGGRARAPHPEPALRHGAGRGHGVRNPGRSIRGRGAGGCHHPREHGLPGADGGACGPGPPDPPAARQPHAPRRLRDRRGEQGPEPLLLGAHRPGNARGLRGPAGAADGGRGLAARVDLDRIADADGAMSLGGRPRAGTDGKRSVSRPSRGCHDGRVAEDLPPPDGRRARMWNAARARGIPLPTILVTVAVVVVVYVLANLVYRLRDVILLIVVAGFVTVILNPIVVALQGWGIRRRGWAVAVVTLWALLVFVGLALAFGYPLANGIAHLANALPSYVNSAEHGRGWIGHLVRKYHVQTWVLHNESKLVGFGQGLAKPALTLGKGAFSLVISLLTIFVLVLLLLLEGPKMRVGILGLMSPPRAEPHSPSPRDATPSPP